MTTLLLVVTGALTGAHAATWGASKDSPYEGFRLGSVVRSVLLGVAAALLLGATGAAGPTPNLLELVGVCYAAERLATEWWKAILREDSRPTAIPMRLAVHGRPVDARIPRYAAGAAVAVVLTSSCLLLDAQEDRLADLPWWATALLAGAGGWLTALGGAWKDAPVEGFRLGTFFRSPLVATAWAVLLFPFASSFVLLTLAAAGWAVLTIETCKSFLSARPPGKFAGQDTRFDVRTVRRWCRLVHGSLYLLLTGGVAAMLLSEAERGDRGREAALLVVLAWASGTGTEVLRTLGSGTVESGRGPGPLVGPPGRLDDADFRGASS